MSPSETPPPPSGRFVNALELLEEDGCVGDNIGNFFLSPNQVRRGVETLLSSSCQPQGTFEKAFTAYLGRNKWNAKPPHVSEN